MLFRSRVKGLGIRSWAIGLGVFVAINLVLYTTFLTNLQGCVHSLVHAAAEWLRGLQGRAQLLARQQDFAGGRPWFYYFMLLPLYEFLP